MFLSFANEYSQFQIPQPFTTTTTTTTTAASESDTGGPAAQEGGGGESRQLQRGRVQIEAEWLQTQHHSQNIHFGERSEQLQE